MGGPGMAVLLPIHSSDELLMPPGSRPNALRPHALPGQGAITTAAPTTALT